MGCAAQMIAVHGSFWITRQLAVMPVCGIGTEWRKE